MKLEFEKYEGLGNDFVIVDGNGNDLPADTAMALCARHRGVGADGVLLCGVEDAGPFMRVINADGSVPEMCGNGLRCAALYFRQRGLVQSDELVVQTAAGPHQVWMEDVAGDVASVRVEMNAPTFDPDAIGLQSTEPWKDFPWPMEDGELRVTAVSLGNPHLVTFDAVDRKRFSLAPQMQDDERLEDGANIGFCERKSASHFVLHVFERGAGWTQACGTGACAAVAAAVATHRANSGVETKVELPGGTLFVTERGPGQRMWMRGPARRVFAGRIEL